MDPNDYGVVEMLLSFGVVLAFLLLGLAGQKEEARTRAPGTRRPIIASRGYHRGMRKGSIARTIGRDSDRATGSRGSTRGVRRRGRAPRGFGNRRACPRTSGPRRPAPVGACRARQPPARRRQRRGRQETFAPRSRHGGRTPTQARAAARASGRRHRGLSRRFAFPRATRSNGKTRARSARRRRSGRSIPPRASSSAGASISTVTRV